VIEARLREERDAFAEAMGQLYVERCNLQMENMQLRLELKNAMVAHDVRRQQARVVDAESVER
jgi:hypothetical protein